MWRHGEPTVRQLAFMLLQKLAGQPATLYRCELLACVCVHVCVHTVYRHIVVKLRDSGRISQRKCMLGPYLCVSCRLAAGNNCAARCLVMPAAFVLSPPLHHKAPVCVQYSTSAHSRPPPAASNRMSRGNPQRVLRTIPRVPRVKGRGGGIVPFSYGFCCAAVFLACVTLPGHVRRRRRTWRPRPVLLPPLQQGALSRTPAASSRRAQRARHGRHTVGAAA